MDIYFFSKSAFLYPSFIVIRIEKVKIMFFVFI